MQCSHFLWQFSFPLVFKILFHTPPVSYFFLVLFSQHCSGNETEEVEITLCSITRMFILHQNQNYMFYFCKIRQNYINNIHSQVEEIICLQDYEMFIFQWPYCVLIKFIFLMEAKKFINFVVTVIKKIIFTGSLGVQNLYLDKGK